MDFIETSVRSAIGIDFVLGMAAERLQSQSGVSLVRNNATEAASLCPSASEMPHLSANQPFQKARPGQWNT
jgi:hypothetical protein